MFAVKLTINFTIMLKKILNLNGAQQLSKNDQKVVNGGMSPSPGGCASSNYCPTVCASAPSGHRCDIHCDCPNTNDGQCNGNGGYFLL